MKKEALLLVIAVALANFVSSAVPPEISFLPNELIACENSEFSYIQPAQSPIDISPKEIFFITQNQTNFEIFSAKLTKAQTEKIYNRTIFAKTSSGLDYKKVAIKIIKINNPPKIEELRVQTISLDKNLSYSKKVSAEDIEDAPEELTFDSKFKSSAEIFKISKNGSIEFTAEKKDIGVYPVEICARDSGIETSAQNECNETGMPKISCANFQLTITEKNRAPTVVTKSPSENFNSTTGKKLNFVITSFDPDGTSADVYWYVDGKQEQFSSGLSALEKNFSHEFEYEKSGMHEIKAEITDGLLKDSVIWKVYIEKEKNRTQSGSLVQCIQKWACSDWNVCQHAAQSMEFGTLPIEEYQKISFECNSLNLNQEVCGFQIRTCDDISKCEKFDSKPVEIKACKFTSNPSCSDKTENCHDQSCEISVDCGGSCADCPSCFDKIKNQNEDGVDCGGSCETPCPTASSIAIKKFFSLTAKILIVALVIFIIYKYFIVSKMKKELLQYDKKQ